MYLHVSDKREVASNTYYPHAVKIDGIEDLKTAVGMDHIAAQTKNNQRGNDNFINADCVAVDFDNSHSENPEDWKTLDDVSDSLPGVKFYAIQSRNYMRQKSKEKNGKKIFYAPREKFHLYFPLSRAVNRERYKQIIMSAAGLFPYLDLAAVDATHFLFGVKDPEGEVIDGELSLDEYIDSISRETIVESISAHAEEIMTGDQEHDKAYKKLFEYFGIGTQQQSPDWIEAADKTKMVLWFLDWASQYKVEILKRYEINSQAHRDATVFCVPCPWSSDHTEDGPENETVVIIDGSGRINFLCRHGHCTSHNWKEYRAKIEGVSEVKTSLKWVSFDHVEKRGVDWLIPLYVPRKGVTVIGADGGVGKGATVCSIISDLSAGRETFLTRGGDMELPEGFSYSPSKVVWLNAEDPYSEVIKPMLEANNANMNNIIALDEKQIIESEVCFSSRQLKEDIKRFAPDLVVFDPLQQFLPDKVKMAERNLMRREVGHAMSLAKECDCAVVIVMHTNKQRQVYGRKRLADSSDMWDIARSVLMIGVNENDHTLRYLSQEKSNFQKLQPSINYRFAPDRTIEVQDRDERRDRDHVLAAFRMDQRREDEDATPVKDKVKAQILKILGDAEDQEVEANDLSDELRTVHGFGKNAIDQAKAELKKEGAIAYRPENGSRGKRKWLVRLTRQQKGYGS